MSPDSKNLADFTTFVQRETDCGVLDVTDYLGKIPKGFNEDWRSEILVKEAAKSFVRTDWALEFYQKTIGGVQPDYEPAMLYAYLNFMKSLPDVRERYIERGTILADTSWLSSEAVSGFADAFDSEKVSFNLIETVQVPPFVDKELAEFFSYFVDSLTKTLMPGSPGEFDVSVKVERLGNLTDYVLNCPEADLFEKKELRARLRRWISCASGFCGVVNIGKDGVTVKLDITFPRISVPFDWSLKRYAVLGKERSYRCERTHLRHPTLIRFQDHSSGFKIE